MLILLCGRPWERYGNTVFYPLGATGCSRSPRIAIFRLLDGGILVESWMDSLVYFSSFVDHFWSIKLVSCNKHFWTSYWVNKGLCASIDATTGAILPYQNKKLRTKLVFSRLRNSHTLSFVVAKMSFPSALPSPYDVMATFALVTSHAAELVSIVASPSGGCALIQSTAS
jgi:hypothetical protein